MLSLVNASAMAEWIFVDENTTFKAYVQAETLHKVGNKAKMWDLMDFKIGQESTTVSNNYRSSKTQYEYDCTEVKSRLLAHSQFSDSGGTGSVLHSHSDSQPRDWNPVIPDSIGHTLWQIACGKSV